MDYKLQLLETEENEILNCIVLGKLVPASRPRLSRFGTYYNEPYKSFLKNMRLLFTKELIHLKDIIENKSIKIDLIFNFKIPKSHTKKQIQDDLLGINRPRSDLDNMAKGYLDSMNKIVFLDDSQIIKLSLEKNYILDEEENVKIKIYY